MTQENPCESRPKFLSLARWPAMRQKGLKNGLWGILDYIAQPVLMLLATPLLLRRLGPSQYGLWMLASALISSGSLISSGFGDAAIKYVASYRGQEDRQNIIRVIHTMLIINLTLSAFVTVACWNGIPYVVHRVLKIEPALQSVCINSFRIGSLILIIKSIESVFVSTLRAFESYGPAVRIAIITRIAILLGAVSVVVAGGNVVSIMLATLSAAVAGLLLQALAVRSLLGHTIWLPSLHRETLSMITGFGCFSWLQCLASISFSQADRIIIGALLGTPALGYYSICTQIAQPVHGLLASGLQFLFPHLSARWQTASSASLERTVRMAFWVNQILVVLLSAPLILGGKYIISVWLGADYAQHVSPTLSIVTFSFALLGMNVTGYYTLLAAGKVRQATYINLMAGGAMLLAMSALIPRFGIVGAAVGRLIYGPVTWLMYIVVYKMFWRTTDETGPSRQLHAVENAGA
jgi:O-antigen/teichoic acid export membrane protein